MRIVIVILLTCIFLLGVVKVCDFDIWYHLASAKYIFQTRQIPRVDIFSHTAQGEHWIDASWLFQIIFYALYLLGGTGSLILFTALITSLTFFALLLAMRKRGALFPISIFAILLAVWVSHVRFTPRPHIFSQLFLAIYSYILFDFSRAEKGKTYPFETTRNPSRAIWLLLPLQIIWSNMHSGSLLGIGLALMYFTAETAEFVHSKRFLKEGIDWRYETKKIKILFAVSLSLVLLSLVTPFGWKSIFYGFFTLKESTYHLYILELRPIYFSKEFFAFWVFFFVGLASFISNRHRRLEDILIFIIFSYLAISARRFQGEFIIVACPAVAENLSRSLELFFEEKEIEVWQKGFRHRLTNVTLIVLIVIFTLNIMQKRDKRVQFGLGVNENVFPKRAVDFVIKEDIRGNMFNTMEFGGYLIWHLYPERGVFIDGRTDVYGPDLLYKEVKFRNPQIWDELVERFDLDYAIVLNIDALRLYPCQNLDNLPDWTLVFWDDTCLVYVKKNKNNDDLIKRCAYQYVLPNSPSFSYLDAYLEDPADRENVVGELKRNLEFNPQCLLAHTYLAYIYSQKNEDKKAIEHLEKAIEIIPYNTELYNRLGIIYQKKGMHDLALKQYKKAVELEPNSVLARLNLGNVYFMRGEHKKALYQYRKALKFDPENEAIKQNARLALEAIVKGTEE